MHARRVLAQAGEHRAERRVDHAPHDQPADEERRQAIEERRLAEQIELEQAEDRRHRHAGKPVVAAGEPARPVRDLVEDRGDGERQHEERQRFRAQDHGAGRDAEQRRHPGRGGELQEWIRVSVLRAEDSGRVCAKPEERAMSERDDARIAEDEVERQRKQDVDQDARAE